MHRADRRTRRHDQRLPRAPRRRSPRSTRAVRWIKRGLAFTPVKFGISFNVRHLNQAGALVHVYVDGSILVNHGGTEMGQGIQHQGGAGGRARAGRRLRPRARDRHRYAEGRQHLRYRRIDRQRPERQGRAERGADHDQASGWRTSPPAAFGGVAADVRVRTRHRAGAGQRARRFPTSCDAPTRIACNSGRTASTPRPACVGIRRRRTGQPFYYFSYGAAVSEVAVDTLTGEWRLLRADVLHDVGRSLNPAIDIGQVEGAFIQGMGWLTTEELVWHPTTGRLMTHAPEHVQDPDRQRLPARLQRGAVRQRERGGQHSPQQGGRRAASAAGVLGIPGDTGCCIRGRASTASIRRLRAPATPEAILDARRCGAPEESLSDLMDRDTRLAALHWLEQRIRRPWSSRSSQARGSAPRGAGTRMLVSAVQAIGTIGGGHLEFKALATLRRRCSPRATPLRDASTIRSDPRWANAAAAPSNSNTRCWTTAPWPAGPKARR